MTNRTKLHNSLKSEFDFGLGRLYHNYAQNLILIIFRNDYENINFIKKKSK